MPTVNHVKNTTNSSSSSSGKDATDNSKKNTHAFVNSASSENWDRELSENSSASSHLLKSHQHVVNPVGIIGQPSAQISTSWGGVPASKDWDSDLRDPGDSQSQNDFVNHMSDVTSNVIGSEAKIDKAVKNLFNSSTGVGSDVTVNGHSSIGSGVTQNSQVLHHASVEDSTTTSSSLVDRAPGGASSAVRNAGGEVTICNDSSWGASLTGSSWDDAPAKQQWGNEVTLSSISRSNNKDNVETNPLVAADEKSPVLSDKQQQSTAKSRNQKFTSVADIDNVSDSNNTNKNSNQNHSFRSVHHNSNISSATNNNTVSPSTKQHNEAIEKIRTTSPGITSWAGLDSFDAGLPPTGASAGISTSVNENSVNSHQNQKQHRSANSTKLKHSSTPVTSNNSSQHSNGKSGGYSKEQLPTIKASSSSLASVNSRVDTNSKVSGWLQSTSPQQQNESSSSSPWVTTGAAIAGNTCKSQEEEFGWTTVSKVSKVSFYFYDRLLGNSVKQNIYRVIRLEESFGFLSTFPKNNLFPCLYSSPF